MPKQKRSDVYVVNRAFVFGGRKVMRRGTLLSADDPAVAGNERNLSLTNDRVEQATAAPGEKRNTPQETRNTPTKAEQADETEEAEAEESE
jgi:hypothetical protein